MGTTHQALTRAIAQAEREGDDELALQLAQQKLLRARAERRVCRHCRHWSGIRRYCEHLMHPSLPVMSCTYYEEVPS